MFIKMEYINKYQHYKDYRKTKKKSRKYIYKQRRKETDISANNIFRSYMCYIECDTMNIRNGWPTLYERGESEQEG